MTLSRLLDFIIVSLSPPANEARGNWPVSLSTIARDCYGKVLPLFARLANSHLQVLRLRA